MDTKNTKLKEVEANRKYYSKSDGNFMTEEAVLHSHKVLDRVDWVREKVHQVDSRDHLDIGCKDGYLCLTLQSEGITCVGVDPSKDSIAKAQERAVKYGLKAGFVQAFVEDVKENIKADTVSMLEVLEHVADPKKVMRKLAKLGRIIMISTPDADGRHGHDDADRNQEHVRLYTKKELERFVKNYGEILESTVRDEQLCIMWKPR